MSRNVYIVCAVPPNTSCTLTLILALPLYLRVLASSNRSWYGKVSYRYLRRYNLFPLVFSRNDHNGGAPARDRKLDRDHPTITRLKIRPK